MPFKKDQVVRGLIIRPDDIAVDGVEGEIKVAQTAKKLQIYLDGALRNVVMEATVATLTNKTINADNNTISNLEVDNLKAGVLNTDVTLAGATDVQVPSALAVKTYIDAAIDTEDEASEISFTPVGSIAATDVQAMGAELDSDITLVQTNLDAHINDATDAHDASAISNVPAGTIASTNVQDAINELDTDVQLVQTNLDTEEAARIAADALLQDDINILNDDLTAHLADTVDAHDASAISNTPSGNLAATDVQGALNELQTDVDTKISKVASTDNAVTRFDGTGGNVQNSVVTISDAGDVAGVTNLTVDNLNLNGSTITGDTSSIAIATNTVRTTAKDILNGGVVYTPLIDATTTGANAYVNAGNNKIVVLTNASLTSIDMIVSLISGQEITLVNRTGNDITINNETGATASYQISTGTGASVTLANKQSFAFVFDTTGNKWTIVGGTGSGTGTGTTDVNIVFQDDFDSSSLADYSITTTMSLVGPILHGEQSATVAHDTVTTYEFKREYSVDSKFRGRNATIISDILSSASTDGLVLLTVTDETNAVVLLDQETLTYDGSTVTQNRASFDIPSDCFDISYHFEFLPDASGGVTTIDDVVCVLSDSLVNETALIQEEDFELYAAGNAGQTITAGVTEIPFILQSTNGSCITWEGSEATINEAGTYIITGSTQFTATGDQRICAVVNGVNEGYISGIDSSQLMRNFAFVKYFNIGDTFHLLSASGGGTLTNNSLGHFIRFTKQGTLRQVNVNSNQKIKIPTSEVRFEGASSLGTGAESTTVQFTSQTELKGSAFTVDNSNGTVVTVTKAGRLTASFSLFANVSAYFYVAKNGTNLRGMGIGNTDGLLRTVTWEGDVAVNDEIKITSSGSAPVSNSANNFSVHHQELEVQVSVSNTLPQYSEDDLVVKALGNSGQVITADVTDIPFTTVSDTTGGAWNGTSFTVPEDGVYSIDASVWYTASATRALVLYVDGAVYRRIGDSTTSSYVGGKITDSLTAGQVLTIRSTSNGGTLTSGAANAHFLTITKVGKPNVTGVDVTPFVNIPRIETQTTEHYGTSDTMSLNTDQTKSEGSGLYSVSGETITAIKAITISVALFGEAVTTAVNGSMYATIAKGGVVLNSQRNVNPVSASSYRASASTQVKLAAGESIVLDLTIASSTFTLYRVQIVAIAESDQIVTSLESFSSDTATFTYANAATYTLSTLENAPVGTYITGTYTSSSSTRVQSTGLNRPVQTDVDMNTNGILVTARVYAASGATTAPPWFAIQIGKGLKGINVQGYASTGKTSAIAIDSVMYSTSIEWGVDFTYNELTGVLVIDAGLCRSTSTTIRYAGSGVGSMGVNNVTSAYITINASKNPAFAGVSEPSPVYANYTSDSGQAIATSVGVFKYEDKVIDTHNAYNTGTGIYTVPETGYYQVDAHVITASVTLTTAASFTLLIYKDGVNFRNRRVNGTGAANFYGVTYSETLYLTAGQTLGVYTQSSVATTGHTSGLFNNLSIKKVR